MAPVAAWGQHQNRFRRRYQILLTSARELRDQGHHEAAIAVAQTACEVCAAIVLTDTFNSRGIGYLRDSVGSLLQNNYNLGNPRVRKLYGEVTQDDTIAQRPFWPKFQAHVQKRHRVVHRGEPVHQADADAAIAAVEKVIEHIQAHYAATWQKPINVAQPSDSSLGPNQTRG